MAAAGSDVPVDGPHLVAGDVFAHLVEIHAPALEDRVILAGKRVIDQAARTDLKLPHPAEDFLGSSVFIIVVPFIFPAAVSRHGQRVENFLDDVVRGDVLGLGFVTYGHAMAQNVGRKLLHVLRRHITPAIEKCGGACGEREIDGGAR